MALKLSNEFISETARADIQALNKFEDTQYAELVSLGMQLIMEPEKVAASQELIQEFASSHGINFFVLKNITKTLLIVLKAAVRKSISPSELKEAMLELGLSQEKADFLSEQWQQNMNAVSHAALKRTLTVNQLVDMEWKFGVTASSSEVHKVGSTFLQLKLVINKGNKMENVYMELSLPQFYSFLHEMEKAKSSLEYLT